MQHIGGKLSGPGASASIFTCAPLWPDKKSPVCVVFQCFYDDAYEQDKHSLDGSYFLFKDVVDCCNGLLNWANV